MHQISGQTWDLVWKALILLVFKRDIWNSAIGIISETSRSSTVHQGAQDNRLTLSPEQFKLTSWRRGRGCHLNNDQAAFHASCLAISKVKMKLDVLLHTHSLSSTYAETGVLLTGDQVCYIVRSCLQNKYIQ